MLDPDTRGRFDRLAHLVGNTPLLAIDVALRGRRLRVYAKAECFNLTGSIKDRIALHMLRRARESGALRPGATIAEATSGNTGISFAALGRALGHPLVVFMPEWMSRERVDLMRSLGAEMRLVSRAEGGFLEAVKRVERFGEEDPHAYMPDQFGNEDNVETHYLTTGPELYWQLQACGREPDAFVAGVGTGGTVMGVGRFMREKRPGARVHPVEPENSPTLRAGEKVGSHRIQGISDEFVPPIVDLDWLDEIVSVDDGDAIRMAQRLSAELGLAVGISSGANFLGAMIIADELGPDATVTTVFADDNKKYLSTDLLRDEPAKDDHLTSQVTLEGFSAVRRTCVTCGNDGRRAAALHSGN